MDDLGQSCIGHLRYLDQIFNSKLVFNLVFGKQIEIWYSPLRESFIEILPEVFMDQNIHQGFLIFFNIFSFCFTLYKLIFYF